MRAAVARRGAGQGDRERRESQRLLTPLLPAPRVPAGLTFWRAHTAVAHARVACVRACVRRSFSRRVFALRVSKMIGYYDRFLLFCLSVVGYCFISGISGCLTTTGGKRKRLIETSVLSLLFFFFPPLLLPSFRDRVFSF